MDTIIMNFMASVVAHTNTRNLIPVINITQQAADEVFGLGGNTRLLRELQELLPVDNLFASGHWLLRVEWRISHNHLKHDSPNTPPIALHSIPKQHTQFQLWPFDFLLPVAVLY